MVGLDSNNQNLEVHELISSNCSQLFETERQNQGFEGLRVCKVDGGPQRLVKFVDGQPNVEVRSRTCLDKVVVVFRAVRDKVLDVHLFWKVDLGLLAKQLRLCFVNFGQDP